MVIEAMNQELIKKITIEELKEVITALPQNKVPRHNGFPTNFFQIHLKRQEETYLRLLRQC